MDEFRCPKCHARMYPHELGRLAAERCENCRGLWIDHTALDGVLGERVGEPRVAGAAELMNRPSSRSTELACPRCSTPLLSYGTDVIEVEWCPGCHGLHLDEGELATIVAWKQSRVARMRKDDARSASGILGEFTLEAIVIAIVGLLS